ncbi:MAG: hypothetical protein LBU20_01150 [Candidatus Nomurabacteria bacterium]|jgi:hypothetical protein|nr:hypothetical protein [Candidatus Nomurabacteria bacterium]
MSEIIRTIKKKDIVTSLLHILFNLLMAGGSLGLVLLFPDSPWAAIGLVIVSKFRVFAVKPRFWAPNILSNLTDFIFCAGIVLLVWGAELGSGSEVLIYQLVLTVLYALWLIFLKPLTKPAPVVLQAGLSQFVGLVALFSVADYLSAPLVTLFSFGIGFAAARHVLMLHKERQYTLLALVWGLVLAELGFLGYHWSLTYNFGGLIHIPEVAVVAMILAFVTEKFYNSYRANEGRIKQDDVLLPTFFGAVALLLILVFFSGLIGF